MIKFYYSFEDEWDEDFLNEFYYHSSDTGYAAEEICEEYDGMECEYPDSRSLWLLKEGEIEPVRVTVNAETVRRYSAVVGK